MNKNPAAKLPPNSSRVEGVKPKCMTK